MKQAGPCITVYGRTSGRNSFRTLTEGWTHALRTLNRKGVPGMSFRVVGGASDLQGALQWGPTTALIIDPHLLACAATFNHPNLGAVVAPHCAYLPIEFANHLLDKRAVLFAPSQFCQNQLQVVVPSLQTFIVRHGVHDCFRPLTTEERETPNWLEMKNRLRGSGVNFVHLAAGDLDRKNTPLLMTTFAKTVKRGLDATLTCVIGGIDLARMAMLARDLDPTKGERIRVVPRLDAQPSNLRWFYPVFDCIIQPSRVEGFGLCPLEALCCGVPALVTTGSGHDEWIGDHKGVIEVGMDSQLGPMPSEPLPCPTVDAYVLEDAIGEAVHAIKTLAEDAMQAAGSRSHFFSWERVVNTPEVRNFFSSRADDGRLI